MCCPFSPGSTEEAVFWRGSGKKKKKSAPLFQGHDIHIHNNLMKINFKI